jgi:hypothetical protein
LTTSEIGCERLHGLLLLSPSPPTEGGAGGGRRDPLRYSGVDLGGKVDWLLERDDEHGASPSDIDGWYRFGSGGGETSS